MLLSFVFAMVRAARHTRRNGRRKPPWPFHPAGRREREYFMGNCLRVTAASILALQFTIPAGAAGMTSVGKGEGEVDIVAWAGYIERGETDKAYDWVTDFEKETGCKVNVKVAGTSDEMVTLMNGGGFDLVTASGDASLRLVAGKTVQEINTDLIPNWKTVDERLQNGA